VPRFSTFKTIDAIRVRDVDQFSSFVSTRTSAARYLQPNAKNAESLACNQNVANRYFNCGELDLDLSFFRLCSLRKDIQDQTAIDRLLSDQLLLTATLT